MLHFLDLAYRDDCSWLIVITG